VQLEFVFVADLFADAFTATSMLADKVVDVYSHQQQQQQQPDKAQVSEVGNTSAGTGRLAPSR